MRTWRARWGIMAGVVPMIIGAGGSPAVVDTTWVISIGETRLTFTGVDVVDPVEWELAARGHGSFDDVKGTRTLRGTRPLPDESPESARGAVTADADALAAPGRAGERTASLLMNPTSDFAIEVDAAGALSYRGSIGHRQGFVLAGPAGQHVIPQMVMTVSPDSAGSVLGLSARDGSVVFHAPSSEIVFDEQSGTLLVRSLDVALAPGVASALGLGPDAGNGSLTMRARLVPLGQDRSGGAAVPVATTVDGTEPAGGVAGDVPNPDIIVARLDSMIASDGAGPWSEDGISAYAMGTTSCNIGTDPAEWDPTTSHHPVIAQNLYRLRENRFEQIGMAWLKHGFAALSGTVCCPAGQDCCQDPGTTLLLGVGCSDPYSASLNAQQSNLGPRNQVDAFTGEFPAARNWPTLDSSSRIARRLQVRASDIDPGANAGAEYFAESQYVAADEAAAGNGENTVSHRRVEVTAEISPNHWFLSFPSSAPTVQQQPAIRAWKATDPSVVESNVRVPGEGLFMLSAKTFDLGDGFWQYEYALYNLNSHRSCGSFRVPVRTGSLIRDVGFHDVDYHSGDMSGITWCKFCEGNTAVGCSDDDDCRWRGTCLAEGVCENDAGTSCQNDSQCPYETSACGVIDDSGCGGRECLLDRGQCDNDWPAVVANGFVTWSTRPYAEKPNANALRWGTLYNFRFQTNVPPEETTAVLGLFRPGFPDEVAAATLGPTLDMIDCDRNGIDDACDIDCNFFGCGEECGTATDCNDNSVPDRCEPDCNENGIADGCDIADCPEGELWCADCNGNTVPDGCETDCDGDGIPDSCDTFEDCDGDGIFDCFDICTCTSPVNGCVCPEECLCCWDTACLLFPCAECEGSGGVPDCVDTPCRAGCTVAEADGDWEQDGDVDVADTARFNACYSGAHSAAGFSMPTMECLARFDFDGDSDIDLSDYEVYFDTKFSGPAGTGGGP